MNLSSNSASTRSMLCVFDTIEVRNEQKISAADREYCLSRQQMLYKMLQQISKWYELLRAQTEPYVENHKLVFKTNGSVVSHRGYITPQELAA